METTVEQRNSWYHTAVLTYSWKEWEENVSWGLEMCQPREGLLSLWHLLQGKVSNWTASPVTVGGEFRASPSQISLLLPLACLGFMGLRIYRLYWAREYVSLIASGVSLLCYLGNTSSNWLFDGVLTMCQILFWVLKIQGYWIKNEPCPWGDDSYLRMLMLAGSITFTHSHSEHSASVETRKCSSFSSELPVKHRLIYLYCHLPSILPSTHHPLFF